MATEISPVIRKTLPQNSNLEQIKFTLAILFPGIPNNKAINPQLQSQHDYSLRSQHNRREYQEHKW